MSHKHLDLTQAGLETRLIHGDRHLNPTSAVVMPIFQTANFAGSSPQDFLERSSATHPAEFYTRYGNPNARQVEALLAPLENAEDALMTASGMGAVSSAVLAVVKHGDHVVAQTSHYGGTTNLLQHILPRFGVEVTQVDQRDPACFERAMRPNTRLIMLETPSNPVMWITDLRAVTAMAKSRGALTISDNTFATPLNQRPIEMGVDIVFHSATKYFGGHSDVIAGVIMSSRELIEKIWNTYVILGASPAPLDAWLVTRGLRTLSLRVRQHNANAMALAKFLETHPAVKAVHYPGLKSHPQHDLAARQMSGFGGMLSVEVKGGYEAANRVLAKLRLSPIAASLGGVESLAVHPAANFIHYMTLEEAERIGIPAGLIRVSVGLETEADIIADYAQALEG